MSEDKRFCKDCKHAQVNFIERIFFGFTTAKCTLAPTKASLVTGKKSDCYFCSTERAFSPPIGCGPSGVNWEAKDD